MTISFYAYVMILLDIDETELPYEDQYLDEKGNFDDYIDYLKSYIISYDTQHDFDYLDSIFININKNNQEDKFFIGKEYNPIQDIETLEKLNKVNIKSNNKLLIAS